ncbi:hypothetical protein AB1M95_02000 [Sulfitobacter sp. LCG007]
MITTIKLIRAGMVLALIGFFTFGTLATPLSATQNDHHDMSSTDTHMSGDHHTDVVCPSGHLAGSHDADDGDCCVGTCTIILEVAAPSVTRVSLRKSNESSFRPMLARPSSTEFYRPPSLTI